MVLNITFQGIKVSNDCKYLMTTAVCKLPVTIHYAYQKRRTRIDLEWYVLHCSSYIIMYESRVATQSVAYAPHGADTNTEFLSRPYRAGLLN